MTYDLGWWEVWKTLLRGQRVLARLPVGQWVLLLGCCRQQTGEGFGEGAQPHSRAHYPGMSGHRDPEIYLSRC